MKTKEEILKIFEKFAEYDVESDGKKVKFESYFPKKLFK